MPFLRRSPRPLSASSLCFKPRMPIHSPGTAVPRYTGIGKCFSRIYSEQGAGAFWRVNFTNCIRYFPKQAFNLSIKDSVKLTFPKYGPKQVFGTFFSVNMASYGLAAAGNLTIVYPLDYARKHLSSDVGSGNQTFEGLFDCFIKRLLASRASFLLRWFWRVHRRNHPVPWLPAQCLRHHRGTQPVEERHLHYYSPLSLWKHRQPWRLQVQAESSCSTHLQGHC